MPLVMFLDDRKVIKHFGPNPERGRVIRGATKRVTVGMRWNLPRQQWEPDDNVLVQAVVAMRRVKRGKWEVKVEPIFQRHAEQFLRDNCQ